MLAFDLYFENPFCLWGDKLCT